MVERKTDKYREYVDHPRYGRRPIITGLNPNPLDADVQLHWNTSSSEEIIAKYEAILGERWPYGNASWYVSNTKRIPNTAILATLSKQTRATMPVTHYFDLERRCRDCNRQFLFFAQEQKYWYEELGFGLESDCVRCTDCRKKQQGIARLRERYESLYHVEAKSDKQLLEQAECCVTLIEQNVFTPKRFEFARMLLNKIDAESEIRQSRSFIDLSRKSQSRMHPTTPTNTPKLPIDGSSDF